MTHVVTLIVDPATPLLTDRHVEAVRARLPCAGAPRWLAYGVAFDLPFAPPEDCDNRALGEELRAILSPEPVDVVLQPVAGRRKRLLVADMDSTLIEQECIDELADAIGIRPYVSAITERSMRGEIAFEPALRERVALLRDLALETALEVFDRRVTFTPGGATLARTMRAHGAMTAVASGGFTIFTEKVAERLGFDAHFANVLAVSSGRLTGGLEEPILGREAKKDVLRALRERRDLAAIETMAVGDGANDLAMLAEAGLGVAFRAKPAVAAAAAARIDHGDLTALLYLQGFGREDFAA